MSLTGGLVSVRTAHPCLFVVDDESILLRVRFVDELRGVLHLNPRLLRRRVADCLGVRFLAAPGRFARAVASRIGDPESAVLLLVESHSRVSHERVAAARSCAMEVSVDPIAVASGKSAIDHFVEEREAHGYVDIVVKIFAVHQQLIGPVGGEVTARLGAVVMPRRSDHASRIRTAVHAEGRESLGLAEETVSRRETALPLVGIRVRRRARGRLGQLEAREYRLGSVLRVGRRIATGPYLYDTILGRSSSLPPEHRVDVRQMRQRHVGRQGVSRTGEIQLSAVLVDLVVLQSSEWLVGGEYHLATVLPVAVVVFLLVGVRTRVIAVALLEEGVGYSLLGLVLAEVLANLARVAERRAAAVEAAVVMLAAEVARTVRRGWREVGQLGRAQLLRRLRSLFCENKNISCITSVFDNFSLLLCL